MVTQVANRPRRATPERWQAALRRALEENVQVRQLVGSGAWLATSGTDATKAYELTVVNGVVRGCRCPAGEHGDPCCKHAARFSFAAGLLDLDLADDPTPPAPRCAGCGGRVVACQDKPLPQVIRCPRCAGNARSIAPAVRPAA